MVRELGDPAGPRVLLLHGGNVAGWMWGPQLPALSDHAVLVPDLPGFGESNSLPWVSTATAADALAAALGTRPAHVVGLSLGASVALQLAARHPHLVSSLLLASAQVAPPRRRDVLLGRILLLAWERRGFWESTARSYGLRDEDARQFVETGLGIRRDTARAVLDEVRRGVPGDVLARVDVPTLALAGGRDSAAIRGESLRRVRAGIPNSRAGVLPGLHHQFTVEAPDRFNRLLRAWLGFAGDHHHSRSHEFSSKETLQWL